MDQAVLTLLSKTQIKTQALKRLRIIKEFLNYVFFDLKVSSEVSEKIDDFIKNQQFDVSSSKEVKILYLVGKPFYELFDPRNLTSQLKNLEDAITNTHEVIVHTPFEMPDEEIERLGTWFKANFGETFLFELSSDPSLIGGCALSYKGIYKDYSLKSKILENKSNITQMLLTFKQ